MDIDGGKGRSKKAEERGDSAPREASGSGSLPHPSNSPSFHEDIEGLISPEDGEVRKPGRKRRAQSSCQVCQSSLSNERPYYQRYRICPGCSTKDKQDDDGIVKRFCQQCGKFQAISLFDGSMRTCRERLDRHAARRRKAHARLVTAAAAAQHVVAPPDPPDNSQYNSLNPMQQRPAAVASTATHSLMDIAQHVLQRVFLQQQQQQTLGGDEKFGVPILSQEQHHMAMTAPRPTPDSLLTPLHEPRPLRFRPPPHSNGHGGLSHVDPATAAAKLEAVLASLLPAAGQSNHAAPSAQEVDIHEKHSLHAILERLTGGGSASLGAMDGTNGAFSSLDQPPGLSLPQHLHAALAELLAEHQKNPAGSHRV